MPANVYECMFLLDTNKVSGDVQNAAKTLHGLIERSGAEILASRPWDERRLAYPIKGHKKGLYYLTYFKVDANKVVEMERDFHLSELILRFMILHVDPKLVDIMLQVARDEHQTALQTVHESQAEEEAGGEPVGAGAGAEGRGGRGPRGPRRAPAEDKGEE